MTTTTTTVAAVATAGAGRNHYQMDGLTDGLIGRLMGGWTATPVADACVKDKTVNTKKQARILEVTDKQRFNNQTLGKVGLTLGALSRDIAFHTLVLEVCSAY